MRSSLAALSILLLVWSQLGCGDHSGGSKPGGTGGRSIGGGGAAGGGGAGVSTGLGGVVSGAGGAAVLGTGGVGGEETSDPDGGLGGAGGARSTAGADAGGGIGSGGSAGVGGSVGTGGAADGKGGSIGLGGAFAVDGGLDAAVDVEDTQVLDIAVDAPAGTGGDLAALEVQVSNSIDYIIIAADGLAASAARYRDFRRGGGFGVDLTLVGDIVGGAADAEAASVRIRDHVRSLYRAREVNRPMYLLLLGDAQSTWPGDRSGVPAGTWHSPSGDSVVSDNVYADVDGDDVPDLAVGRITADNDAEVDLVRAKVAAYEANHEPGEWNRRLNLFASTSGMGDLVDVVIETIVYDITEAIPYDYDVTMTYARQSSPYVYVPEQFSDQVYRRINEGSLLTAYVGHGYRDGFAKLDWNGSTYPILDTDHLEKLAAAHKPPILLFVACTTGAFAGAESVSERILVRENAPAAIFSSTENSDPYANAVFTYEVSQVFTSLRAPRVGDAFLEAKQRIVTNADGVRQKIESLAGLLVSTNARDALKHSHLHMYTLFGDPAMAMTHVGHAQIVATTVAEPVGASSVTPGAELTITTTVPSSGNGAEAIVTLESARKLILGELGSVPADGSSQRDAIIVRNYQLANDKVAVGATVPATATSFATKLVVPADLAQGLYHIKVFVHDSAQDWAGTLPMTVE